MIINGSMQNSISDNVSRPCFLHQSPQFLIEIKIHNVDVFIGLDLGSAETESIRRLILVQTGKSEVTGRKGKIKAAQKFFSMFWAGPF